jgi:hypothetical protein
MQYVCLLCSVKIKVGMNKNLDVRFKVSSPINYYHVDFGIRYGEKNKPTIKIENVTSNGYITLL